MNAPPRAAAQSGTELRITCSDGVELSARVYGPDHGPRLVLSHGNGLAIDGYRCFWELLTHEFQVVVFDMRGHGRSGAGLGLRHTWSQFYDDIEALRLSLDAQLGPAPTFGVFHSLSAVAAFGHRRRYGPRWDGLLLFDPPFMPPDGHPVQALHTDEMMVLSARVRQRRRRYRNVDELARQFARHPVFRRWRPEAYQQMAEATLMADTANDALVLSCAPEHEAHIYDTNSDPTLWRLFGESGVPLMLVCSDPDVPDAPPSAHGGRAVAAEFGVPYRALSDTSHFLQIEQPEACAEITRRFCRETALALIEAQRVSQSA